MPDRSVRPSDSALRARLGLLLAREGLWPNHKKLRQLFREERLRVRRRRRGGRKRAVGTRAPITLPDAVNQRWSLDFASDTLADGRRFRMLCVVDNCSRECLALVADTWLSGVRVSRELDALAAERGLPMKVVSDNGPEPMSVAILRWSQQRTVSWHHITPPPPAFHQLRWRNFCRLRPASRSRARLPRASSVD